PHQRASAQRASARCGSSYSLFVLYSPECGKERVDAGKVGQALFRRIQLALVDDGFQVRRARNDIFEDLPCSRNRLGRVAVLNVGIAIDLDHCSSRDVHLYNAIERKAVEARERRESAVLLENGQMSAVEQQTALGLL